MTNKVFVPECLAIYLSNRCSMACCYCFSGGPPRSSAARPAIDEQTVGPAAHLVAAACAKARLPVRLILTGGGEPMACFALARRLVEVAGAAARTHGVASHLDQKFLT